jgi:hypothetical protein
VTLQTLAFPTTLLYNMSTIFVDVLDGLADSRITPLCALPMDFPERHSWAFWAKNEHQSTSPFGPLSRAYLGHVWP